VMDRHLYYEQEGRQHVRWAAIDAPHDFLMIFVVLAAPASARFRRLCHTG